MIKRLLNLRCLLCLIIASLLVSWYCTKLSCDAYFEAEATTQLALVNDGPEDIEDEFVRQTVENYKLIVAEIINRGVNPLVALLQIYDGIEKYVMLYGDFGSKHPEMSEETWEYVRDIKMKAKIAEVEIPLLNFVKALDKHYFDYKEKLENSTGGDDEKFSMYFIPASYARPLNFSPIPNTLSSQEREEVEALFESTRESYSNSLERAFEPMPSFFKSKYKEYVMTGKGHNLVICSHYPATKRVIILFAVFFLISFLSLSLVLIVSMKIYTKFKDVFSRLIK